MHALAVDGTFDDCQALVKGLFNHHAFRDRVRLSGVNSINWARIVAQVVYYFTAAARSARRSARSRSPCRPAISATSSPATSRKRMGLPIDRLVIATNVNDILARTLATGAYEVREVVRDLVAVDGHPGVVEFRAPAVRGLRPRRRGGARADGVARAVRRFALSRRALSEIRAVFAADRADEDETAATIRTTCARPAQLVDPHTAVGLAVAEKETRDPAMPMVVLATAHPAKFPDAVEAACGVRPALPDWLADLLNGRSGSTALPNDQAAVENFILAASRAAREGAAA